MEETPKKEGDGGAVEKKVVADRPPPPPLLPRLARGSFPIAIGTDCGGGKRGHCSGGGGDISAPTTPRNRWSEEKAGESREAA